MHGSAKGTGRALSGGAEGELRSVRGGGTTAAESSHWGPKAGTRGTQWWGGRHKRRLPECRATSPGCVSIACCCTLGIRLENKTKAPRERCGGTCRSQAAARELGRGWRAALGWRRRGALGRGLLVPSGSSGGSVSAGRRRAWAWRGRAGWGRAGWGRGWDNWRRAGRGLAKIVGAIHCQVGREASCCAPLLKRGCKGGRGGRGRHQQGHMVEERCSAGKQRMAGQPAPLARGLSRRQLQWGKGGGGAHQGICRS